MNTFVKVAKTHDLAEGGMVAVLVGDTEILLAQVQGQYYAMSNICSHAEYWVQQGNLSREIRDLLITQLSVGDLARREAITRWCAAQFQALAGPTPSPLEAMLVDEILTCWLDLDRWRLTSEALDKAPTRGDQQAVQQRVDAAQQRLLKAVKTLAQIRKLGVPVVQINVAAQQTNVAG